MAKWTIDHDNVNRVLHLVGLVIPSNSYDITLMDGCESDYNSRNHKRDVGDECDLLSHMHIAGMINVDRVMKGDINYSEIICDYLVLEEYNPLDDVVHRYIGQWLDEEVSYSDVNAVTLNHVANKLRHMQQCTHVYNTNHGIIMQSSNPDTRTLQTSFNLI